MGTSTESFLATASVLGVALGIAMFEERPTGSILATVLTAALLATFALVPSSWTTGLRTGEEGDLT
jgi:hypothetical protein